MKFYVHTAATVIANKKGIEINRNNAAKNDNISKISGEEDDNQVVDDEDFNEIQNEILLNNINEKMKNIIINVDSNIEEMEIVELSLWQLYLPQDVTNKILIFLSDPDMYGYLNFIAKTNPFKPNEVVYKSLCSIIYTAQSKKKSLNVENWKTWKNMLVYRPRIRTNGFYSLRTLYSRAPSNDIFWEEKITQSIEVKFYRHMRFFNDGYMLYSLDTVDPVDIGKQLRNGI
jgi:hypothetical protein